MSVLRKQVALVSALVTLLVAGHGGSTATAGPNDQVGGRIAYQRADVADDVSLAFTIDPDGSNEVEIGKIRTDPIAGEGAAPGAWSPDGSRLLLEVFPGRLARPATSNADGSGLSILDAYPDEQLWLSPSIAPRSWSPDGQRFLVSGNAVENPQDDGIYTLRASDGADRVRLTTVPESCEDDPLGYSPDGSRVLFTRACGPNGTPPTGSTIDLSTLYSVASDGSDLRQISPPGLEAGGFQGFGGDWSPDGQQVTFAAYVPAADSTGLFVVNADGTGFEQVVSTDIGAVAAQWSPDGTQIAFSSRFRSGPQIWIVRPDGTDLTKLTAGAGGATSISPVWSPDGNRLLYQQLKDGEVNLWTMGRDGSGQSQLTSEPVATEYIDRYSWGEAPAATTGVDGCVPECLAQNGVSPGPIPPGLYTTRFFFAGALTLTLGSGWTGLYDAPNELHFQQNAPNEWHLLVWLDPYPVQHLKRVEGVERTPAALMAAWQDDPTLIVTPGPAATIGDGLPAVTLDLQVSDAATKEVADCPDACTNYIGFENGPDAHGIVRSDRVRIYLAPVVYGGQSHLLGVSVEDVGGASFETVLAAAQTIIDTIRMPVAVDPAASSPTPLPGGRLAYGRFGPGGVSLFTNNPAGTDERSLQLHDNEGPRWSPNGTRLSTSALSRQGLIFYGLVNPDGSGFTQFDSPDPTLQLGCGAWSPDGAKLACEGWDDANPGRNGVYTVQASDGGELTRVTTNLGGGHDVPGDFSPDGRQIVFVRLDPADEEHSTLMAVNVDGTGERPLTDRKVGLAARWSRDGRSILTEADGSLLRVVIDGGTPVPIRIQSSGAVTATRGAWSSDGTWIAFSRVTDEGEDIYVMQADGTDLHQVTATPGQNEEFADWGNPALP